MAVAVAIIIFLVLLLILLSGFRIVQEYERGVIFRLGRCVGPTDRGSFFAPHQTLCRKFRKFRKVPKLTAVPALRRNARTAAA